MSKTESPLERLSEIVKAGKKEMHPDPVNNYLEKEQWIKKDGDGPEFVYQPTKFGKTLIEE